MEDQTCSPNTPNSFFPFRKPWNCTPGWFGSILLSDFWSQTTLVMRRISSCPLMDSYSFWECITVFSLQLIRICTSIFQPNWILSKWQVFMKCQKGAPQSDLSLLWSLFLFWHHKRHTHFLFNVVKKWEVEEDSSYSEPERFSSTFSSSLFCVLWNQNVFSQPRILVAIFQRGRKKCMEASTTCSCFGKVASSQILLFFVFCQNIRCLGLIMIFRLSQIWPVHVEFATCQHLQLQQLHIQRPQGCEWPRTLYPSGQRILQTQATERLQCRNTSPTLSCAMQVLNLVRWPLCATEAAANIFFCWKCVNFNAPWRCFEPNRKWQWWVTSPGSAPEAATPKLWNSEVTWFSWAWVRPPS